MGQSLHYLLCSPFRGRTSRNVEAKYHPSVMGDEDEYVEQTNGCGLNGEEINCDDFHSVGFFKTVFQVWKGGFRFLGIYLADVIDWADCQNTIIERPLEMVTMSYWVDFF